MSGKGNKTTAQLVEEWKQHDPFLIDVDGFQHFLDEQIPRLSRLKRRRQIASGTFFSPPSKGL